MQSSAIILMLGNDAAVHGADLITVIIENECFSLFRGNGVDRVATEKVGYEVVFAGSIHECVIILFDQESPPADALGTKGIESKILVVGMDNHFKTKENVSKMFE